MTAGGCATQELIGYRIADVPLDTESGFRDTDTGFLDTDSGLQDTESGFQDTDTDTGALFPMIFTFDKGDDGFSTHNEPGWAWNASTGTFDLDVTFTGSPEWRTLDFYAGEGIWPGGIDWRGATSIEYRVRVEDSNGGYFRAFIQSIEEESFTSETWFWYAADTDLIPDGAWYTLTIDLTDAAAPLNLEKVTKMGLQIHAVEPLGVSSADTDYPLPEHVLLQIDSVIVIGADP